MQLLVSVMSYLIPSKLSLYICLNSFEQMKVTVRNKDCPLPSPALLGDVNVAERQQR